MGKVFAIALNTYRELIREKYFLIILFVGILLLAMSFFLGELSFAEQEKILADVGFFVIHLTAVGMAALTGSVLLSREIEKQTCLLTLSRPVDRSQFLFGKVLGVVWLISLVVLLLTFGIQLLMWGWKYTYAYLVVAYSLWIEAVVVLFMVLMASVVVRPVLAFLLGLNVLILGHWLVDLEYFANKSGESTYIMAMKVMRWLIPNFDRFNWKSYLFLQEPPSGSEVFWLTGHGLSWVIIYFIIARMIFGRKDIV